jgi:hypothetical protein
MKYRINMIRQMQAEEHQAAQLRSQKVILAGLCFVMIGISALFATYQIFTMKGILRDEKKKLKLIEVEYQQYRKSRMIVNKADIELLDKLQNSRIFWTKKLVAMAKHLPKNYWIDQFSFVNNTFLVEGFGYISQKQKQLITLDEYLNLIRKDETFNDVFKTIYLNSTVRNDDEKDRLRISFDYTALKQE